MAFSPRDIPLNPRKMPNIIEILGVLSPVLSSTNIVNLSETTLGILRTSLPVTTKSVAQSSDKSLRTIERFYAQAFLPWLTIRLLLFKRFFFNLDNVYLIALDETNEQKSGKSSYGVGRFYSSLFRKVIRSVNFLGFSLVNTATSESSILWVEQSTPKKNNRPKQKRSSSKKGVQKKTSGKGKPKGRPKGSKNKPYQEPKSQSFQMVKKALKVLLPLLNKHLPKLNAPYLVGDGAYGNQHYQKLSESFGLQLITKLKHNAHLIFPYQGKQKSQGKKRHLGKKVDYTKIPKKYLVTFPEDHPFSEKNIQVFQFKAYAHRMKGVLLNIVVIQKYNPTTKKTTQTVLMSTDTNLEAVTLIRSYSLRFQIEFDFRDAKQYFGLSSFKNYKKNQLTNAVNIAFTMCLISRILLKKYKEVLNNKNLGVLDLKAILRVQKYVQVLLNTPQNDPEQFLKQENILDIIKMEAINL